MTLSAWDRNRLAAALPGWLPARRWFSAKGRAITGVELPEVADLGRGLVIALADVRVAGEREPRRYQLPLVVRSRPGPDAITELGGAWAFDATDDPGSMRHLLDLVAAGGERDGVRFTPEAALRPVGPASPVRRLTAEQSNTSVVFGDRYILKFFRRLFPGVNPEVEVQRARGPLPTLA
ncbi:hypothetical protein AB0G02_31275, partial [Actinosynnema sp. NPDC023658]